MSKPFGAPLIYKACANAHEVIFMQSKQNCFKIHSEYQPTGDQPQAIETLAGQLCGEFK